MDVLDDNTSVYTVQSGGDISLYSNESDLMSTGTIDLFSNFINKHQFKKQMQTGGSISDSKKKQKSSKTSNGVMTIENAVKLLNDVYK